MFIFRQGPDFHFEISEFEIARDNCNSEELPISANKRVTTSASSANSADKILIIFMYSFPTRLDLKFHANCLLKVFLFSFHNRFWQTMQVVSSGDNLREMSYSVLVEKIRKINHKFTTILNCLLKF